MVPIDKVKDIINRYDALEKELSSQNIDPKLFAKIKRIFKFRRDNYSSKKIYFFERKKIYLICLKINLMIKKS